MKIELAIKILKHMLNLHKEVRQENSWNHGYCSALEHCIAILEDRPINNEEENARF